MPQEQQVQYEQFFRRGQDCPNFNPSLYTRKISRRSRKSKEIYLFEDCFSHHIDFNSHEIDSLRVDEQSSSRFIKRDTLSAYFINKIYCPPSLLDYDSGLPLYSETTEEGNSLACYNAFIQEVSENSFADVSKTSPRLGSNRLRYIVGDVGEGKSAFLKRVESDLIRQRNTIDEDFTVICVHLDLEQHYNYRKSPKSLKKSFSVNLYRRIEETIKEIDADLFPSNMNAINPENNPRSALKQLCHYLRELHVRLVVIIDNLDFYHYYYTRYAYIEKYNKKQEESVEKNILWLKSEITAPQKLGYLGVTFLVAVRRYIYEDVLANSHGTDTDRDSSRAVNLGPTSDAKIVSSRFNLLGEAISVISNSKPRAGEDLHEALTALRFKMQSKGIDEGNWKRGTLTSVSELGQHGHRSLVDFLSALHFSYLDRELVDRFLDRQTSSLLVVYYNNTLAKYSQSEEHFPNMFLNDCLVSRKKKFKLAHQPHEHTYWLKYLILRLLIRSGGMTLKEILEVFQKKGDYREHLVRHAVGSLCTTNEFNCATVDPSQYSRDYDSRKIVPTKRAEQLLPTSTSKGLCFEFEYLSTIIDDKWLALPVPIADRIYNPTSDFSHLYETGHKYGKLSAASVLERTEAVLKFISVLEASYRVEIVENKTALHQRLALDGVEPRFTFIRRRILNSRSNLINHLKSTLASVDRRKEIREIEASIKPEIIVLQSHFRDYYSSGVLIES